MEVIMIYDKDNDTNYSKTIKQTLFEYFSKKDHNVRIFNICRENIKNCSGCVGCWIKTPGECVKNDLLNKLNCVLINSDLAIFISAIIFGQYSSSIKNVIDRFIPNVLPFYVKKNGITVHPERYNKYPVQILIGYGDGLTIEEKDTFITLTNGKYNKSFDRVFVFDADTVVLDTLLYSLEEYNEKYLPD